MVRPRKHQDIKSKLGAARDSRRRYEDAGKRKNIEDRRRLRQRYDKLAISDFNLDDKWHIHNLKKLDDPPLPPDLAGIYNIERCWIYRPFFNDPLWVWSFRRDEDCVRKIGRWITAPSHTNETLKTIMKLYDDLSVQRLYDGWYTRLIIDTFQSSWSGLVNDEGELDLSALMSSTDRLLCRMRSLILEVADADKFCIGQGFLPGTRRMMENLKWEQEQEREWDSVGFWWFSQSVALSSRFWKYQELVLHRAEIWMRYHLRHDQLLKRYNNARLPWQSCWIQMQSTPASIANLITAHIQEPIRNTNYSLSELDESKLIVMDDCCYSEEEEEADDNSSNHLESDYRPSKLDINVDLEPLRTKPMNIVLKNPPYLSIAV